MTEREYENAAEESKIPSRSSKRKKKEKSALREMLEVVVVALALAFLIKTFVVGNFWIHRNPWCLLLKSTIR